MYAFEIQTGCVRCTFDGLTFGGLTMVQPYSGILSILSAGCTGTKLRNIGTYASPLNMGGAYVNATWTRSTTTMTVTKVAHGLKASDTIAVIQNSDVAPKANTTTTATLWTVLVAPTADTFTVTVTNAGQTTGQFLSYYPTVAGFLCVLAAGAAADDVKVQRCYVPHTETNLYSLDNSNNNIRIDNVISNYLNAFTTP